MNEPIQKILQHIDDGTIDADILLQLCERVKFAKGKHSHEGYCTEQGLMAIRSEVYELEREIIISGNCYGTPNDERIKDENLDVMTTSYRFAELIKTRG